MYLRQKAFSLALCGVLCSSLGTAQQAPLYPDYPSETPQAFQQATVGMDYERRDVMIPMRDGVKLHTVILVPKGATHAGMLMTRTPYSAVALTTNTPSAHLGTSLWGYDNAVEPIINGGYIRVVQDIRGKYGSEGDYVMNRPMHGPLNPTPVDESTDTYDTIDWLIAHIPETNGKVGVLGISYDGFLSLTPLVHPHPALKCVVPMNPMVDGWMGDDWFHHGAFRQQNMPYIYEQTATRSNEAKWLSSSFDDYDMYMAAGSAGALGKQRNMDQIGFWNKVIAHPAYDSFWSGQAMDKLLAAQPLTVPTMLVHSLWDQEDIYGSMAVYKALRDKPEAKENLFLVIGPWHHGQEIEYADALGPVKFRSDTGLYFRQNVLAPFLAHYLQDGAPAMSVAPVTTFETGANRWQQLQIWPSTPSGALPQLKPLFLHAAGRLTFTPPVESEGADEYTSDPAKPVPFRARPSQPVGYTENLSWARWLVDDQREFSGRPDVLTFTGDTLTAPLTISGEPMVHLLAATTGTDVDWVVKLIDVYPAEVAGQPEMGGYQLPVSMDILRGRYRESYAVPKAISAGKPLAYAFSLPVVNHVFLPGHRVMMQVQSSWFPLYDRNPQTFVPNIFFAQPTDYKRSVETVFHSAQQASSIDLPIAPQ